MVLIAIVPARIQCGLVAVPMFAAPATHRFATEQCSKVNAPEVHTIWPGKFGTGPATPFEADPGPPVYTRGDDVLTTYVVSIGTGRVAPKPIGVPTALV